MNIIGIMVISAILGMFVWMALIMIRAQKLKGDKIPLTNSPIDKLVQNNNKVLLYFYSPNCGQCVAVTPVIDKMMQEQLPVTKMDISQHLDIARLLNIRATPTLMVVEQQQIQAIHLGSKSEAFIRKLIS